ncbi:hypothetical protein GGR57DRAFT_465574 [Xylariaceae sp. FL1272]|nr:hypothetical protein GGR57DRAFT_465574 [Xylariaceae sp. FL1272]
MEKSDSNLVETFHTVSDGCSKSDASSSGKAYGGRCQTFDSAETISVNTTSSAQYLPPTREAPAYQHNRTGSNPVSGSNHSDAFRYLSSDQPKRLSMKDALGLANASMIVAGTILSLATLAFLVFLWAGRGFDLDGHAASRVWRTIMFSGSLTQLVTISSLILRASISAQTAICTSFVAALVLERRSVPLSQSASLSVLRSVNAGPRHLIWQLLRRNSWYRLFGVELGLFYILALGSIAIQFASTVLVSDLHDSSLVGFPQGIERNLTLSKAQDGALAGWEQPVRDYSLFGELYSGYRASPDLNGLSDTGSKRHAMMPFNKPLDRMTIREYDGPSIVFSSRVACMPPTINDGEISDFVYEATEHIAGTIQGQVLVQDTLSRAGLDSQGKCDLDGCPSKIPFECAVPTVPYPDYVGSSFCTPQDTDPNIFSSPWRVDITNWTSAANVVLVFSSNVQYTGFNTSKTGSISLPKPVIKDEWVSYDFGNQQTVNASFCYIASNLMLSNVSMGTNVTLEEPTLGYRNDLSDTQNIRRMLGADPQVQGLSERDILTVSEIKDNKDHVYGASQDTVPDSQFGASLLDWFMLLTTANQTFTGCEVCEANASLTARDFRRVFLDTLTTTQRASVALQTSYTILAQSLHDQFLEFLTLPSTIKITRTQASNIPVRYSGLIAVVVLVVVDLMCILLLTALYLSHSRYSMIGDYWHAISQIVSDISWDILPRANQRKDRIITRHLRRDDRPVRLVRLAETGLVKIVDAEYAPVPQSKLRGTWGPTSFIARTWQLWRFKWSKKQHDRGAQEC